MSIKKNETNLKRNMYKKRNKYKKETSIKKKQV